MASTSTATAHPTIVSRDEWLAARKSLLAKEKEAMRHDDAVSAQRRRLPMVEMTKPYVFDTPAGRKSLADLFEGRRQLLVYHFMFDPADPPPGKSAPWSEGCPGCSFVTDNLPHLSHLNARDTTLVLVSRAPLSKIEPFKRRMGWDAIPWVSSFGTSFNYDFHVTTDEGVAPVEYNYCDKATLEKKGHTYHIKGEQPGVSGFLRLDDGRVFHTYSSYGRGLDAMLTTNRLLDLTPYGRQETWEDSPAGWPQEGKTGPGDWVRHHDKYGDATKGSAAAAAACCHEKHA
jgi:predicted dithiol-disulfide oxidoreductase (DUF899 family)